jgi:hypothetical protein
MPTHGHPAAYLAQPDTNYTKGYIDQSRQFSIVILDKESGCLGKDSITVTYAPVPPVEIYVISTDGNTLSTTEVYDTYQWLLNGQSITGAERQVYLAKENGS